MGSVAGDQRCPRRRQVRKWPLGMTERHCPFLWRRLRAVTSGGGTGTPCPARQPTGSHLLAQPFFIGALCMVISCHICHFGVGRLKPDRQVLWDSLPLRTASVPISIKFCHSGGSWLLALPTPHQVTLGLTSQLIPYVHILASRPSRSSFCLPPAI